MMAIFTIRTTVGRENVVIDAISTKLGRADAPMVKALVHPEQLKGYIFAEGEVSEVQKIVQDVPHVRGVIQKPIEISEIARFLEEGKIKVEVNLDDIIEIVGGPFKGEKGRIIRINESKNEVTVELTEATVPIPVTVSMESIRVLESKNRPRE